MVAPGFAVLRAAASVIPKGASFVVRTVPAESIEETWYYRFAVGLLPGRRVLPAQSSGDAEYVVLVGPRPAAPEGALVLETPEGSVWKAGRH